MSEEAKKPALEAAYLAGFNASGEGYNGEYPFSEFDKPEKNSTWIKDRDNYVSQALKHYYPWAPSEKADWHLIAAAPEMLEALKLCEGNIASLLASAHPKVFGKWLDVVRAAIAKATGEKA